MSNVREQERADLVQEKGFFILPSELFANVRSNAKDNEKYIVEMVDTDNIAEEGYNLSVSTYVEQEDTREKIDIKVLNQQIKEIVAREDELRKSIDKIIAEIEAGE